MTYEKLETLSRIYNTLLLIKTCGEDTMMMTDCLRAMKGFITKEQSELDILTATAVREEGE
jgi:hypothetical protein